MTRVGSHRLTRPSSMARATSRLNHTPPGVEMAHLFGTCDGFATPSRWRRQVGQSYLSGNGSILVSAEADLRW